MMQVIASVVAVSFAGVLCILAFGLLMEHAPVATVAAGLLWLAIYRRK